MKLANFNKKNEIIFIIEELLDDGYDKVNANDLIEAYKTNKKQDVVN